MLLMVMALKEVCDTVTRICCLRETSYIRVLVDPAFEALFGAFGAPVSVRIIDSP